MPHDHQSDQNEWKNLAGDPEHSAVTERLREYFPATDAANANGSRYGFNEHFGNALK